MIREPVMRIFSALLSFIFLLGSPTTSAQAADAAIAIAQPDPVITAEFENFVFAASSSGYARLFDSMVENNPRGNFDVRADNDVYVFAACGENCQFMTLNVYSKTFEKQIHPQDESNEPKKNFINFSTTSDARFSTGGTATCIDPSKPCAMRIMVFQKALTKSDAEPVSEDATEDDDTFEVPPPK
jgi:hypothetical protein